MIVHHEPSCARDASAMLHRQRSAVMSSSARCFTTTRPMRLRASTDVSPMRKHHLVTVTQRAEGRGHTQFPGHFDGFRPLAHTGKRRRVISNSAPKNSCLVNRTPARGDNVVAAPPEDSYSLALAVGSATLKLRQRLRRRACGAKNPGLARRCLFSPTSVQGHGTRPASNLARILLVMSS